MSTAFDIIIVNFLCYLCRFPLHSITLASHFFYSLVVSYRLSVGPSERLFSHFHSLHCILSLVYSGVWVVFRVSACMVGESRDEVTIEIHKADERLHLFLGWQCWPVNDSCDFKSRPCCVIWLHLDTWSWSVQTHTSPVIDTAYVCACSRGQVTWCVNVPLS
jgi:hypothetical protein